MKEGEEGQSKDIKVRLAVFSPSRETLHQAWLYIAFMADKGARLSL